MGAAPGGCHCAPETGEQRVEGARMRIALVGAPNVGKSALFNRLTGRYVTVSNYPGTSIEVARGSGMLVDGAAVELLDTPGMYSLLPSTEEEAVTRRVIMEGGADVFVHVVDAKNLPRMLSLTLQLAEVGRPLVVALNMMDEAERLGMRIDAARLASQLGVAVVPIVAVEGLGLDALRAAIARAAGGPVPLPPVYGNGVGAAIGSLRAALAGVYPVDPSALAALLLQGDADATAWVRAAEPDGGSGAVAAAQGLAAELGAPVAYRVAVERQRAAEDLAAGVVTAARGRGALWVEWLGRALARPATGIPALLLVLYLGLYLFVGRLGGGTLVDWLEGTVFGRGLNPLFERLFAGVPSEAARSLFVGEYGVLTLGLRYAVAIILPIVGAFFLFFSVLEDSGYFPRLALLVDRVFKRLGLSGRAVIPLVLGFACDTMATMVTRTLETRRERVLATLLLALAIPCSAQLGVILAVFAGQPLAFGVWVLALVGTFVLVGAIGARILPGAAATFYMELPPLRRPRLGNVLVKTYTRIQWYFLEVLPLFLGASVLLWAGQRTGVFAALIAALQPVVGALGLPAETARVFLFGFFRRDYGAAGLFDLTRSGALDQIQLAVAGVTLTLFVPCVAQFLMMMKERGVRTALGMLAFITPFAFGAGYLLNLALRALR
jgi:ferrous iron transport protein B